VANIYTNVKSDLTTNTNTSIFTVPAATTAIIKSFIVSNDSGSADAIQVEVLNTTGNVFSLFKSKAVGANTTVDLLTNPLILTENEQIKVQATTADRLHVILSMLQLNRD
jgi:hypothetical protein|tara:strand:+ start:28 stop:357 length:330 start_codon:yes stop_codon:yes gene_type:complete